MYYKDKREGLSKEGSGRVALYKTIGLIHSYTLECCYACGRVMNTMAPAVNSNIYNGRISPPQHTELPPKFLPEHYHNVGKGVAIAALDMIEMNPCTRIKNTTFGSLEAIRNWVKFYIRSKTTNNKNIKGNINRIQTQQSQQTPQQLPQSNKQNHEGTSMNRNSTRRNTAPTNNFENVNKKLVSQLSNPGPTTTATTNRINNIIASFKETRASIAAHIIDNKSRTGVRRNSTDPQMQPSVATVHSKSFVRKTPQRELLNHKSFSISLANNSAYNNNNNNTTNSNTALNNIISAAKNEDENDFRNFNSFIDNNYNDDKDSDKDRNEQDDENNCNKQFLEDENVTLRHNNNLAKETDWFFKADACDPNGIHLEKIEPKNVTENENDKLIILNKPNSRLQKLSNNITRNYIGVNPLNELYPVSKVNVMQVGNSSDPLQHQIITGNFLQPQVASSALNATSTSHLFNKNIINKNLNNDQAALTPRALNSQLNPRQQLSKKQTKTQLAKNTYNANLIKKFFNTKKLEATNRNDMSAITTAVIPQQQINQQQTVLTSRSSKALNNSPQILYSNPSQERQELPNHQLQLQQKLLNDIDRSQQLSLLNSNANINNVRRKIIETKNKLAKKNLININQQKVLPSNTDLNAITKYFENKSQKKKRIRDNARKVFN